MSNLVSEPLPLVVYDDALPEELGALGSHEPPIKELPPLQVTSPFLSPIATSSKPQRWVDFPTTLFKSSLLPVSAVYVPLSPLSPEPPKSSTFTQDRQQLWRNIVSGNSDASPSKPASPFLLRPKIPPWREPQRWVETPSLVRNYRNMEEATGESDMDFSD